ncbi:unnamed protein product [Boreogadus saida]
MHSLCSTGDHWSAETSDTSQMRSAQPRTSDQSHRHQKPTYDPQDTGNRGKSFTMGRPGEPCKTVIIEHSHLVHCDAVTLYLHITSPRTLHCDGLEAIEFLQKNKLNKRVNTCSESGVTEGMIPESPFAVFIADRGAGVSATRADCERVRQSLGMALRGCQVVREMESRGARPPDMRAADSLAHTHRED